MTNLGFPVDDSAGRRHTWLLLRSGAGSPAENMAWDEALLESARELAAPVLRFYGWSEPAATFGYFQRFADVEQMTPLRPLIRRPTGGGLVPHDADWTYSVVIPPGDPWYDLKAVVSYRRVHEWIQAAFAHLRMETALSPGRRNEASGQCFVGAEQFDLLQDGRKIAGAAQRRNRAGLLIQGSVQPPPPDQTRTNFEQAMCAVATQTWAVDWRPLPVSESLHRRVTKLMTEKYSRESHHRSR